MNKQNLDILRVLEEQGFKAYVVGGYVRDYLIGRKTLDIDICTNATPKEIIEIFEHVKVSDFSSLSGSILYVLFIKNSKYLQKFSLGNRPYFTSIKISILSYLQ